MGVSGSLGSFSIFLFLYPGLLLLGQLIRSVLLMGDAFIFMDVFLLVGIVFLL